MQSFKQAVKSIGKNKYSQNLLGESLEELVRKATAKSLENPDELANAQVCQAITDEQNLTPKDITNILKKRLHTTSSNPHKQWLTILLVGKVLADCQPVIGMHTEELLTEVARIVTKYSRFSRETPIGIRARNAARDLLRNSPAGLQAIRHVAREAYITPQAAFGGGGGGGVGVEKESLKDEVKRMIDCANNLAEVLNEMLVNNGDADLLRELLNDLTELRSYFNVNLEQLMNFPGEDVEAITKDALEAMDALDNTLALQEDVLKQPQELAPGTTAPAAAPAPLLAAPVPSSSTTPAPPAITPTPAPIQKTVDLLDLLDFNDPLPPAAPPAAAAVASPPPAAAQKDPFADPFADLAPLLPTSPASKPTPIPIPAPLTSPNAYLQQSTGGYNGLHPNVGSPGMNMAPPQNFSPPPQSGFNPTFPSSPVPQQYAPQNTGYNSFSPPQQPGYMMNQPGMYNQGYMQQQTGYGMPGYGSPAPMQSSFQSSSNNPFNTGAPGPYSVQSTGTNPFMGAPNASVDQEFERIFADRAQSGAPGLASPQQMPPQQQQQQQQQWQF